MNQTFTTFLKNNAVNKLATAVVMLLVTLYLSPSHATENAVSFYVPGLYGDLAIAVAPEPGNYVFHTSIYNPIKAANPVFPGEIDESVEAIVFADLVRFFWVPDATLFGLKYLAGIRVLWLDVDIEAQLNLPTGLTELRDHNSGIADLGFIPVSLYWNHGNLNFNLYQAINAPTAKFDKTRLAQTSLHHWIFDTVLSVTWLDPKYGLDISLATGIIYNTKNLETDYKSGTELHIDYMFNKFLTPELAVGVHGSHYQQLTGDTGSGAILGSFKGKASSIGPAIIYSPTIGSQKLYFTTKWLNEFNSKNHFEGDLYYFTAAAKF